MTFSVMGTTARVREAVVSFTEPQLLIPVQMRRRDGIVTVDSKDSTERKICCPSRDYFHKMSGN